MALTVSYNNVDRHTVKQLDDWLASFNKNKTNFTNLNDQHSIQIEFVKINRLFDWLIVNRLTKAENKFIIVLVDKAMLHTAPLALRIAIHDLFTLPIKKSHLFRSLKTIIDDLEIKNCKLCDDQQQNNVNDSVRLHYLNKIIVNNEFAETDLLNAIKHFQTKDFPNIVCLVDGYANQKSNRNLTNTLFTIKKQFNKIAMFNINKIDFLPDGDFLIITFKIPETVRDLYNWSEGRKFFKDTISSLANKYNIHITISFGSVHNDPKNLYKSYEEAHYALSIPPYQNNKLRYYDELTNNQLMLTAIQIINSNLEHNLQAHFVAKKLNLSYTYFCRIFKRELKVGFSEYVTFARLQKAQALLLNTDYTIEEISDYVGFNTHNYFSEIFKKYTSTTPSEFRQMKKIKF